MKNKNKFCQHKDVFERMNYLYQASYLMATSNRVAASYFGNNMVACAKKAVLRMEPDLKRSICKWCQSPLIPGESARVRLLSNPLKGLRWTCLTCMNIRKFVMRKGYKLWLEQPESIIETLDFTAKSKNKNTQKCSSAEVLSKKKDSNETRPKNSTDFLKPDLKENICEGCQRPLIPSESIKSLPNLKGVRYTCPTCMNIKKFLTQIEYKLWLNQSESSADRTSDFTANSKDEIIQKFDSTDVPKKEGQNEICPETLTDHLENISQNNMKQIQHTD
ncbi:hypothetical protein P5V15_009407 [Pogonomyrmex californicus]